MTAADPAPSSRWEHFPHGADIGVRGVGETRAAAFAQAALALAAVVTDPAKVRPVEEVVLERTSLDPEMLLVEMLDAIIHAMATRRMLFSSFDVEIDGPRVRLTARGEPVDVARHEPAVEPKGATLTELRVARGDDGLWRAQCIVDV
jgi:SHS2 domain-containing protein